MKRLSALVLITALGVVPVRPSLGQVSKQPPAIFSKSNDANDLFLKARDYYSKSDPRTGGKLANAREAIKLYQQAIANDPQFALAYVEMSRAWLMLGYSDPDGGTNDEILPPARAAVLKAIALDPKLPEAHLGLAALSTNVDFDWGTAEREYKVALQLRPDDARAHASYASFLNSMGRFQESLDEATRSDTLVPSLTADLVFARTYYSMRSFDKAREYCRKSLARQDNVLGHFFLGLIDVAEGQYDVAISELESAAGVSNNGGALAGLAYACAMAGKRDRAMGLLAKLNAGRESGLIVPYRIAAVHLALGDRDRAMEWLEKSYTDRDNWMNQLKVDPVMDPLRSDPRFQALVRKMQFN